MRKYFGISLFSIFFTSFCFSQSDTTSISNHLSTFEKITKEIENFKVDTSSVPNDKISKKIIELRKLRGGFNINEFLEFKLTETKQKSDISKEEFDKISDFLNYGNGKKWLDNSMIWIYRKHFTYKELKKLVKFYKTPIGNKMATDFPIIVLKSVTAAEAIRNLYNNKP